MNVPALSEKFSAAGTIVSAMGCASCFPALGSLGAVLGLGFLVQFEGLFINMLLPVFAGIALLSVAVSWWFHQQHLRSALGAAGPLMVLATLYLFWTDDWSTWMFYFALALMLGVSVWDFVSPARPACPIDIKDRRTA
ncbi:MAG: mercury transporter MerC [Gammaproteobacteria bacterium RIFCSPLOWO2_02_FULL_61_13]|nr:MAG: mercury transporter MerC [Gammaproteobacteria bacterium RIFCSPLOWO2_02_FULL_61_13]